MSTRLGFIIVGGIFLAVFANQIANRMTTDAINIAVGFMLGLITSVPISFGLMLAVQKRQQQNVIIEESAPVNDSPAPVVSEPPFAPSPFAQLAQFPQQRMPYPPVIVVTPQNGYANPYNQTPNISYPQLGDATPMQERNWKIVGEEEE